MSWDVGGTGSKKIGAESFDTVTPQLFFGKGFGDLPGALDWVKPAALTGAFGLDLPTRRFNKTYSLDDDGNVQIERELNAKTFNWGFSVQYNLQYLQSFVRDVGLPQPFNRMIPIVEFAMQTPDRGAPRRPHHRDRQSRASSGSAATSSSVSRRSSRSTRCPARTWACSRQIHFYLDDIAPKIFTWTPFNGVLGPDPARSDAVAAGCGGCVLMALLGHGGGRAWAHAFPDHSEPRVEPRLEPRRPRCASGSTAAIEPVFSTLAGRGCGQAPRGPRRRARRPRPTAPCSR